MAIYYLEVGASESGDGSSSDPFHVDGQTALDDILNGVYANSTSAASGDIYIFKDGTYASGLRLNADGHDGITFKGENFHKAHFPTVQLGPLGDTTGNVLTRSTETTNFENLSLEPNSRPKSGGGTINLTNCLIKSLSSGAVYGVFQMGGYGPGGVTDDWLPTSMTFTRCLLINQDSSGREFFTRRNTNHTIVNANLLPNPFKFDYCTIISKGTQPVWEGNSGGTITIEINNSIVSGEGGTTLDTSAYESFVDSANNWAYQFGNGNLPNIGTSDPLFADPANENYRLRPGSPCLNKGL